MNCKDYHALHCQGQGPHQEDEYGVQGLRELPSKDGEGPLVLCYKCYDHEVRKHNKLRPGWRKLKVHIPGGGV